MKGIDSSSRGAAQVNASWGRREVDGVNHRGIKLQIDMKIGVI